MSKMMHCPACMKSSPKGRARHLYDLVEINDELVYAWVCDNCGHIKPPRAQQKRTDRNYIMETATSDKGLSVPNKLAFHAFNPNGLYADLQKVHERVSAAVDAGKAKSGAILAYGSFNDYPRKSLFEQLEKSRKGGCSRIMCNVTLDGLQRAIRQANEWLETLDQ